MCRSGTVAVTRTDELGTAIGVVDGGGGAGRGARIADVSAVDCCCITGSASHTPSPPGILAADGGGVVAGGACARGRLGGGVVDGAGGHIFAGSAVGWREERSEAAAGVVWLGRTACRNCVSSATEVCPERRVEPGDVPDRRSGGTPESLTTTAVRAAADDARACRGGVDPMPRSSLRPASSRRGGRLAPAARLVPAARPDPAARLAPAARLSPAARPPRAARLTLTARLALAARPPRESRPPRPRSSDAGLAQVADSDAGLAQAEEGGTTAADPMSWPRKLISGLSGLHGGAVKNSGGRAWAGRTGGVTGRWIPSSAPYSAKGPASRRAEGCSAGTSGACVSSSNGSGGQNCHKPSSRRTALDVVAASSGGCRSCCCSVGSDAW
jgi:hypothetical protein